MSRPLLEASRVHSAAQQKMGEFHAATVREVASAVEANPVVVVGMAQNPFVKKVRKALDAAGVPFTYLEYGSYLGEWKRRLAVKMWSGWPTFPQVFVKGELLGGFAETEKALADGTLKARLGGKAH
jgi:monothiol glutaredoxin